MKYQVILVPTARADLDRIIAWIARKSARGAARLLARFHQELALLAENPSGYSLAPEAELIGREIRQALFKTKGGLTYRALFDVQADHIRILRIRGPGQHFVSSEQVI